MIHPFVMISATKGYMEHTSPARDDDHHARSQLSLIMRRLWTDCW